MKRELIPLMFNNQMMNLVKNKITIKSPKIHIIIPVYNESKSIRSFMSRINSCFKDYPLYKITIVDDGSTDNTIDILKQFKSKNNTFNLKSYEQNRGKGFALRYGFKSCQPDEIVITMDSDGEHLPEDIFKLIQPIIKKRAYAVIGSRFIDNKFFKIFNPRYYGSYANNGKKLNFMRRFGNWIFSLCIWLSTQKWIIDSQSGFRAFAPGVVQHLDLKCNAFQIETEMVMELITKGFKIVHVPIQTGFSGRPSYMHMFSDSIKNILTIIRIKSPRKLIELIIKVFPGIFEDFLKIDLEKS